MAKKGIDVSEHNGTLDWGKIKGDFALIRGGFGSLDIDGEFANNVKNCPLPLGIYWFSYAYSVERAKKEAERVLSLLGDTPLTLPVFFDWEYDSDRYAKENGVVVHRELFSAMARAFMDTIKAGGYKAGIYYNHDYYKNYCDSAVLNPKSYAQWYAYYGDECGMDCDIWQYTDKGTLGDFTGDMNELRNEGLLMSSQSRVLRTGENEITNSYGGGHGGVDLVKSPCNLDDIIAHTAGEVVFCQSGIPNDQGSEGNRSYGNCVKLLHDSGYRTLYAHMDSVSVDYGEWVKQGQTIGFMG
ncbi:MAG: GH25 family lysozyme, partial [Oscillospiraceae bacterium]